MSYEQSFSESSERSVEIPEYMKYLAYKIFEKNEIQQNWGWNDHRSLSIAEFWLTFHHDIKLIIITKHENLVYSELIMQGIEPSKTTIEQIHKKWTSNALQVRSLLQKFPGRCLVCEGGMFARRPMVLIRAINKAWRVELGPGEEFETVEQTPEQQVALQIAAAKYSSHSGTNELARDLSQLGALPDEDAQEQTFTCPTTTEVISAFQTLRRRAESAQRWSQAAHEAQRILEETSGNWCGDGMKLDDPRAESQRRKLSAKIVPSTSSTLHDQNNLSAPNAIRTTWSIQGKTSKFTCQKDISENEFLITVNINKKLSIHFETNSKSALQVVFISRIPEISEQNREYSHQSRDTTVVEVSQHLELLSTAGWDAIQGMLDAIGYTLQVPEESRCMTDADRGRIRAEMRNFAAKCVALRNKMLIYTDVFLVNEQKNPDYEHIWIRIEGAELAHLKYPVIEFRLSSYFANKGEFGKNIKIEFPEQPMKHVLDQWYPESEDDHGPKLELRFSAPNSMDNEVWSRLSKNDKVLVIGILLRISMVLATLDARNEKLSRGAESWNQVASFAIGAITSNLKSQ
ncbi:MAG: hypothetical protein RLO51_24520 [Thalassobaculum sp.]|uniref:hypothetical protein n=1 Tax=Thalassobaculum sp. TaxID=2022740 RepID=UPI0032EC7A44